MRRALLAAAVLLPAVVQAQDYGDYHALVIGNDDYEHVEKLKTAVADARAVAELLKEQYGYTVTLIENGTRRQIVSALGKYRKTLKARENLLVYYAGHGLLDKEAGEGYWFPVDARDDDEADWISNATITTRLKTIPAKRILVVSDSCYSGSLTRALTVKIRGQSFRVATASMKTRVVLTSGGLEPVEDGGGSGHSIFAKAFLDALAANKGVLEGYSLFKAVKPRVMLASDQEPDYGNIRKCGHQGGDFLFVRRSTPAGPAREKPTQQPLVEICAGPVKAPSEIAVDGTNNGDTPFFNASPVAIKGFGTFTHKKIDTPGVAECHVTCTFEQETPLEAVFNLVKTGVATNGRNGSWSSASVEAYFRLARDSQFTAKNVIDATERRAGSGRLASTTWESPSPT